MKIQPMVWLYRFNGKRLLLTALYLLVAITFSYYYSHLKHTHTQQYAPGSKFKLAIGEAHKPFQYRALVPFLVKKVSDFQVRDNKKNISLLTHYLAVNYFFAEVIATFLFLLVFRAYLVEFLENKLACSVLSFSIFLIVLKKK